MTDEIKAPEAPEDAEVTSAGNMTEEAKPKGGRNTRKKTRRAAERNPKKGGDSLINQVNPANPGISIPAYEQNITINSLQAQKVMRRVFSRASSSLYRIDVILRIISTADDADAVESIIEKEMHEVEEAMTQAKTRFETLLENNGITSLPVYDVVYKEDVRIISPHVGRFLGLVRRLDELVSMIDALWLNGLVVNKDRNSEVYRWQQRIITLGSRIINLERRARQSARTQGKESEVDAVVPEVNDEITEDILEGED